MDELLKSVENWIKGIVENVIRGFMPQIVDLVAESPVFIAAVRDLMDKEIATRVSEAMDNLDLEDQIRDVVRNNLTVTTTSTDCDIDI